MKIRIHFYTFVLRYTTIPKQYLYYHLPTRYHLYDIDSVWCIDILNIPVRFYVQYNIYTDARKRDIRRRFLVYGDFVMFARKSVSARCSCILYVIFTLLRVFNESACLSSKRPCIYTKKTDYYNITHVRFYIWCVKYRRKNRAINLRGPSRPPRPRLIKWQQKKVSFPSAAAAIRVINNVLQKKCRVRIIHVYNML